MTSDDIPKYLTKDEVLKIKNVFFISFYYKDNFCVKTDNRYMENIVEFPDENGRMKKYITDICLSRNIQSGICKTTISANCTANSECLSNKCF